MIVNLTISYEFHLLIPLADVECFAGPPLTVVQSAMELLQKCHQHVPNEEHD